MQGPDSRVGSEHLEFEVYMQQPRGSPKLDQYIFTAQQGDLGWRQSKCDYLLSFCLNV